jgi:hypothetical protein
MSIVSIPIIKAGQSVDVDTDAITDNNVFGLIVMEGLKVLLNSRMAKVGSVTKLIGTELASAQTSAMNIAKENLNRILTADAALFRGKAKAKSAESDIDPKIRTEARRIARDMVRDLLRERGLKPSKYAAKDITIAADGLIAKDPSILDQAKANLANRAAPPKAIDVEALGLKEDPKKVKEAADKAAKAKEKKTTLSAAQAGKTTKRRKANIAADDSTAILAQVAPVHTHHPMH